MCRNLSVDHHPNPPLPKFSAWKYRANLTSKTKKMNKELIMAVQQLSPKKGSNAGKVMSLVNGKFWVHTAPTPQDTHIITEEATGKDGKQYTNFVGYSADSRMVLADKKAFVTSEDASYSVALASLLR